MPVLMNDMPPTTQATDREQPMMRRTSSIKVLPSKGDGATLPWLLQAATLVVEALTFLFVLAMLLSFDQAPSTIERLNWAWKESVPLNGIPGFQAWCNQQFSDENCADPSLAFRADITAGLRAAKIKAWVWDAGLAERRNEYTAIGLYTNDVSDTNCVLPSGLCGSCDSPTVGAFVMLIFLLGISLSLLVLDASVLINIGLYGVDFLWSRAVLHFTTLILIAIVMGLVKDKCLNDSNTNMNLQGGPMFIVSIFVLVCSFAQIAIQIVLFLNAKQRGKVGAW